MYFLNHTKIKKLTHEHGLNLSPDIFKLLEDRIASVIAKSCVVAKKNGRTRLMVKDVVLELNETFRQ